MGTYDGKLMNVGSSTVNVGMNKVRFDLCGWRSVAASLVFTIIAVDARNNRSSIVTFVGFRMSMPIP